MTSKEGAAAPPYADEEALAAGLRAMEPSAWRALFEAQYGAMYRYAYLRVGNQHEAEDIAASVFAEAVRGIGKFNYRGVPVARWLYGIAHHQTVDVLQKRRPTAPLDAAMPDGQSAIADVAERSDLSDGLAALKEEHREVLLLRFIEDRSVRDTAEAMRKTEGAIKVLQGRALNALRRRLQGASDAG